MSTVIYQKTLKGVDEVNHRSDAVSSRLRRLLIMIDGRKNTDQLQKIAPVDNIEEALQQLSDLQLIKPHEITMAELISDSIKF